MQFLVFAGKCNGRSECANRLGDHKGEVHEQESSGNPQDIVSDHSSIILRRIVLAGRGGHFGTHRAAPAAGLCAAHLPRPGILLDAGLLGLER